MRNQSRELEATGKRLEALLAETAAYRAYFRRADSTALIYPALSAPPLRNNLQPQ